MKTYYKYLITAGLCLFVIPHSFAQRSWSEWVEVWSYGGQSASVSFNVINNCGNFSYSFFRTDNSISYENSSITLSFQYFNCDGDLKTQNAIIDLDETGVDDNKGMWFLSQGGGIKNIRAEEVYIPSKEIWLKRVNGQTVDYWKLKYGN